eukprot:g4353.t1
MELARSGHGASAKQLQGEVAARADKIVHKFFVKCGYSGVTDAVSYSGRGNNVGVPMRGAAGSALGDRLGKHYADGIFAPARASGPGARALSLALLELSEPRASSHGTNALLVYFVQLVARDLSRTGANSSESLPIPVPPGDPFFDADARVGGAPALAFARTAYVPPPAGAPPGRSVRRQRNAASSFLDLSPLYGVDNATAAATRLWRGGALKLQAPRLLPMLTLVTVFAREHNRLARELGQRHPLWSDEQLFRHARCRTIAQYAAIALHEVPRLLLGAPLRPYRGYNASADPSTDAFAAGAALRFGHSAVAPLLARLGADLQPVRAGAVRLVDVFPDGAAREVVDGADAAGAGVDSVLRGLLVTTHGAVDAAVDRDLVSGLFGGARPPAIANATAAGARGPWRGGAARRFDLIATNIQRGRDWGLPSAQEARRRLGLSAHASFDSMCAGGPALAARLRGLYGGDLEAVDPYVAGLCEPPMTVAGANATAIVGATFARAIADQLQRSRDGDRLHWERACAAGQEEAGVPCLAPDVREWVRGQTMAELIDRNSDVDLGLGRGRGGGTRVDAFRAHSAARALQEALRAAQGEGQGQSGAGGQLCGTQSVSVSADGAARALSWSIDEGAGTITLELTFPALAGSYVGVGFDRHGRHAMQGTSIVVARMPGGGYSGSAPVIVSDMFASDVGKLEAGDGRTNLALLQASVEAGTARVSVSRVLFTGASQHADLRLRQPLRLSFAHGTGGTAFAYHGANRGSLGLDLYTGTVGAASGGSSAVQALRTLHGGLMFALWGCGVALGIAVKRYAGSKTWHARVLASTAGFGSFVGIVLAHIFVRKDLSSVHAVTGITLVSAAFLQGMAGYWLRFYHKRQKKAAMQWALSGKGGSVGADVGVGAGKCQGKGEGTGSGKSKGGDKYQRFLTCALGPPGVAEQRFRVLRNLHRKTGAVLLLLGLVQIETGLHEYRASARTRGLWYGWLAMLAATFAWMERRHRKFTRRHPHWDAPAESAPTMPMQTNPMAQLATAPGDEAQASQRL